MSEIVGNIPGDGRSDPGHGPRIDPKNAFIPELNFARGTRIRVLKDNGTRGLVGLEGVVVQSLAGSVVVELDRDPLDSFRTTNGEFGLGGFQQPLRKARRHFRVTEVERVG